MIGHSHGFVQEHYDQTQYTSTNATQGPSPSYGADAIIIPIYSVTNIRGKIRSIRI
jgi:hypothetical protein